jgi:uncharacterized protein (DUF697 family)
MNVENELAFLIPFAAYAGTWAVSKLVELKDQYATEHRAWLPFISMILATALVAGVQYADQWFGENLPGWAVPIIGAFMGALGTGLREVKKQASKIAHDQIGNGKNLVIALAISLGLGTSACAVVDRLEDSDIFDSALTAIVSAGTNLLISKIASFESTEGSDVDAELVEAISIIELAAGDGVFSPVDIATDYTVRNKFALNALAEYHEYLQRADLKPSKGLVLSVVKGLKTARR